MNNNPETEFEYFDEIVFAETVRKVLEHIEDLPANLRTVLKKYYLQGKKNKEIALDLSTTTNAVKLQKSRAIKQLKQKLRLFLSLLFILF